MAYQANQEFFTYSNTNQNPNIQPAIDPLASIGGWAPIGQESASRMYRSANTDAPHFGLPNMIFDNQIDGGPTDPVTGDWYWVVTQANAGLYGKIIADDQVSSPGSITIDQPLKSGAAVQASLRTFKRNNMFDSVDAAAAVDGYVDYRQIWFMHNNGAGEGGFKFHVVPLKPNGCHLDITIPAQADTANTTGSQPFIYLPADRFEDPFNEVGIIKDLSIQSERYDKHDKRTRIESVDAATPRRGMNSFTDNDQWTPLWIKRTIRPGTRSGECAFLLKLTAPTAVTPDPDPYESGFIMTWFIDQPIYSVAIEQDRIAYTGRSARLKATITDDRGVPVPNLNAWMVLDSGPGTVTSDMTGRTDDQGVVRGLYNSPSTPGGGTPVVRAVIPTNTET